MSRQQKVEKLIADAKVVGHAALALGPHEDALHALLSAFCTIASAHPCCVQVSARLLRAAGEALLAKDFDPPPHQVH